MQLSLYRKPGKNTVNWTITELNILQRQLAIKFLTARSLTVI